MYRTANNSTKEARPGEIRILAGEFMVLCLGLLVLGVPHSVRAQSTPNEYQVKAAFLFHFAQLVEWPADVTNAGDQSITLCIWADEPRLQELKGTLEGKLVGIRVLHVHLLSTPNAIQGCNILFLSRDEVRRQAAILKSLQGQPVLTVGETGNFLSDGGMIQLHLEKDKVRFDINAGVADSSHIRISSQLLLLATSVTLSDGSERGKQAYAR
jgi:hypothetical protein